MMVAVFSAGKGNRLGHIRPLSGALIQSDGRKNNAGYAFGSGYGYLILFSGITASFGSLDGWSGKLFGVDSSLGTISDFWLSCP